MTIVSNLGVELCSVTEDEMTAVMKTEIGENVVQNSVLSSIVRSC